MEVGDEDIVRGRISDCLCGCGHYAAPREVLLPLGAAAILATGKEPAARQLAQILQADAPSHLCRGDGAGCTGGACVATARVASVPRPMMPRACPLPRRAAVLFKVGEAQVRVGAVPPPVRQRASHERRPVLPPVLLAAMPQRDARIGLEMVGQVLDLCTCAGGVGSAAGAA
jgi:hypothetical protein